MHESNSPAAAAAPAARGQGVIVKGRVLRQRIRATTLAMLRGLVPGGSAIHLAETDTQLGAEHFDAPICRNCGAERVQPYCGACGQSAVGRFSLRDLGRYGWESVRVFEAVFLHSALRLLRAPGLVAREYVLGARSRHVHPIKLLLFAVAVLVVLLEKTAYLTAGQSELSQQMRLVTNWARWSFGMGLFALALATWLVLRRRLNCNLAEHLVLAVYAQFLVIAANAINLLPLLWLDAAWVGAWRRAATWYMTPLELLIVVFACQQFFRLQWRRDGWRIALVVLVFFAAKKALLFAYGRFIVFAVSHQLA